MSKDGQERLKKTDLDVCKLKEMLQEFADYAPASSEQPANDSYYVEVLNNAFTGITEYGFENAEGFKASLKKYWECSGKKELTPLIPYCTASVFRYYRHKYDDTEQGDVVDFIYEF